MTRRCSAHTITSLEHNEVFVFGSNLAGVHGKGAAKMAHKKFGAVWGRGEGLYGKSYGIPTKDRSLNILSLDRIENYIRRFLVVAVRRPEIYFLVTRIGCGLSKYSTKDIAPLFFKYDIPENVYLPEDFWEFRGGGR